ncbi:MAG: hypothetical protein RIF39_07295 [Cyclobacteriaceae bacterium]
MRYILLLIILTAGLSCQQKKEDIELEVIKSTLLEVIDTLYYREIPPPPPRKAYLPDSSDLIVEPQVGIFVNGELVMSDSLIEADSLARVFEQQKWFDSVTQAYKTFDWEQYRIDSLKWLNSLNDPRPQKRIVLLVFDSLVSNRTGNIDEVANLGFEKDFEIPLKGEYADLVSQLQDSSKHPISINFEHFSSVGKYQIEPERYKPTEQDRIAATLVFSRVAINNDRTKAAYYYQEHCGFLCGYGYLVFVERSANGWKVIGMNMVWIS